MSTNDFVAALVGTHHRRFATVVPSSILPDGVSARLQASLSRAREPAGGEVFELMGDPSSAEVDEAGDENTGFRSREESEPNVPVPPMEPSSPDGTRIAVVEGALAIDARRGSWCRYPGGTDR